VVDNALILRHKQTNFLKIKTKASVFMFDICKIFSVPNKPKNLANQNR